MPLSPQDILPAIPRQKVKNTNTGVIGDVVILETVNGIEYLEVLVLDEKIGEKYFESFPLKDCEPVTDEPRPFRVGDKVIATSKNGSIAYTTVRVKFPDGTKILNGLERPISTVDGKIEFGEGMTTRHATPEEIAAHFAPNV